MFIRSIQVLTYILYCFRFAAKPWNYFQLNSTYFNESKGIFSKQEINNLIPEQWRLNQFIDRGQQPDRFPVFLKPEWGQNAYGVQRADNPKSLLKIRQSTKGSSIGSLIQQAAPEKREFEVFIIPSPQNKDGYSILSITEAVNNSRNKFPINSIHNTSTAYINISNQFSDTDKEQIWKNLKQIGNFNIARFCLRANTVEKLIKGHFHVIEINLFTPMPLLLLSCNVNLLEKLDFILDAMKNLAKITKQLNLNNKKKSIFFNKLKRNKKLKNFVQKKA